MSEEGIEILTDASLKSFQPLGREKTVVTFECEGQVRQRETGFLFLALGRVPATRGLALNEIGIDLLPSGHVRPTSSSKRVFLISTRPGIARSTRDRSRRHPPRGDGCSSCLGKKSRAYELRSFVDRCFYRSSVALVGLFLEQLHELGIEFLSASYPFDDHGKSILMEAKHGYVAVHAEKSTGRVLGAECVEKDAGELIHSLPCRVSRGNRPLDQGGLVSSDLVGNLDLSAGRLGRRNFGSVEVIHHEDSEACQKACPKSIFGKETDRLSFHVRTNDRCEGNFCKSKPSPSCGNDPGDRGLVHPPTMVSPRTRIDKGSENFHARLFEGARIMAPQFGPGEFSFFTVGLSLQTDDHVRIKAMMEAKKSGVKEIEFGSEKFHDQVTLGEGKFVE